MSARLVAMVIVVALTAGGPLAPLAAAQQPAQPEQPSAQVAPPLAPPVSAAAEERALRRAFRRAPDFYDLGALAMTVVGAPLKLVVCAGGVVVGAVLFVATFGSGDKVSAAVVREGCTPNWIVTGKDIRPDAKH
jgi:hypothetical protein